MYGSLGVPKHGAAVGEYGEGSLAAGWAGQLGEGGFLGPCFLG